jgi:hypothetical protein
MFRFIKNYFEKCRIEKEQEKQEKINHLMKFFSTPMTEEQVHDWNARLIIESAGCLGGDYKEPDIKFTVLRDNSELFSEEDYAKIKYYLTKKYIHRK